MSSAEWDVVVIGAGAAGLTAYRDLTLAGLRVLCLEARDRVGGRLLTVHDPLAPIPVELGAEFVHGRPRETWEIVRQAGLTIYDCAERAVRIRDGKPDARLPAWELVGQVMQDMERRASSGPDISFETFIRDAKHAEEPKRLATSYVEGFNAARKEIVSIQSLAEDSRAADAIEGDQSYRILNGYDALALHILRSGSTQTGRVELNAVVHGIDWNSDGADVHFRSALAGTEDRVRTRYVLVTVPLGVLQAGSMRFTPEIPETIQAACRLKFGHVIRVIVCFREPFWEAQEDFANAGFLLSDEKHFPTWWTTLPVHAPILVGWSAASRAEEMMGEPRESVLQFAIADLARVMGYTPPRLWSFLEAVHYHPWHEDPFALGAYSYVPAGALPARRALAQSVKNSLFFAGEATELNGHSATVHGAIATGKRAAAEIINARNGE